MKRLLLATALATSATVVMAADSTMIFRWRAGLVTPVAGHPGGGSGGEGSGGGGDHGSGSGGGSEADGEGNGSGSGEDGGSGGGGGDEGNGDGSGAARMALTARPADDQALRDRYRDYVPFGLPAILAAPTGTYRDGDILTVCWDTEINDAAGIAGPLRSQVQLPPSPLVRAVTVAGQRVERNMDSFDMVTIDRPGGSGCADLELTVPAADSYGWGMCIPFGVRAQADVYNGWWARNAEGWEQPGAYNTQLHDAPAWHYIDAQRIEGGTAGG
jgi:hypothetical protein